MFWLASQFALEYKIELRWIYLESCHGKGILDGIGAVVKKAIKDVISYNPDIPTCNVLDLLTYGCKIVFLPLHYTITKTQVLELQNQILCLERVTGTMKIHEVQYKATNGELSVIAKDASCGKGRHITLVSNFV